MLMRRGGFGLRTAGLLSPVGFGVVVMLAGCSGDGGEKQLTANDFATTRPMGDARSAEVVTTRPASTDAQKGGAGSTPGVIGSLTVVDAAMDDGEGRSRKTPVVKPPVDLTIKSVKVTSYTMDAMVGQVNGNPIYAATVLDKLRELEALGRNQSRTVFQQRARSLIGSTLEQIVYDALILGVAERDLSDVERKGLEEIMKDHRARLIRQYGQGSQFIADEQSLAKEGKTIDQLMQEFRSIVLVNRYFKQKLLVKVHVSRRDIERYYLSHYADFNQAPAKRLRFIWVPFENTAKFEELLKSGKPFKEVASDPGNMSRAATGGLYPDLVMGNEFSEGVNQVIGRLQQGKYEGPIRVRSNSWFVYCEEVIPGVNRPLREVQLEIEEGLKRDQTRVLTQKYQTRLLLEGSYGKEAGYNRDKRTVDSNNRAMNEMVDALLAVAMARYAQPAAE
jgi:hypothetical protein